MLLEAFELEKKYTLPHKTVQVLKGAEIKIDRGETLAVIGRSGAGKSTLLHVLGGLDRPDRGDVMLGGVSLYNSRTRICNMLRAQKIGFVFQAYHLLPEMDVLENVMLPAMAAGGSFQSNMRSRAMDLLKAVGLTDRATHKPLELSGGEQQRVALARSLINYPELILADEPTGNLDAETGGQVMELLMSLSRERGLALVMVTHSPEMARLCRRVAELRDGLLVESAAGD